MDVGGERARRCFAAAASAGFHPRQHGWNRLVARAPTLAVEKSCGARGRGRRRAASGVILGRARGRDVRETTRDRLGEVETSTRVAGSRSTSRPSRGISQSPNDGFPRSRALFRGRATRGGHSRDHARRRACCDHWHDASWALCTVWSCRWRVERGGSGVSARRVFDAWPKPRSGDEHRR